MDLDIMIIGEFL